MTTEQPSPDTTPRKRQRRLKQDSEFIFENSTTDETEMDTPSQSNKQSSTKSIDPTDENTANADLYEPGELVWSKLGSFPWWPALIYRCDAEDGIYTKTMNSYNKSKRQFFVYFYGKYLEYSWLSTRGLLKYAGLSSFIQHAEAAVQQASTKSEQLELANRYQLKVSMKKRVQWDEAIELADRALTMTKAERIKEFNDLLKDVRNTKNSKRARKISVDKYHEENLPNKHPVQMSSVSLGPSEVSDAANTVEKPSRASTAFQTQNGTIQADNDEQPVKKKRGRKPKSESKVDEKPDNTSNLSTSSINTNRSVKTRTSQLTSSPNKTKLSSQRPIRTSQRTSKTTNENEIEYEYPPSSSSSNDQQASAPIIHLIQANLPPLSNYEQKQIVEGLLNHNKELTLTFDEAQTFAMNKAIEIVYENHTYRMNHISPEWFYDSILLKYPSVVFKYRSWFEEIETDIIPNGTDIIKLKQWQISLMLQAQIKAEESTTDN